MGLDAHRFYLGKTGTGVAILLLFVLGWLTAMIYVGFFLLVAGGIWLLVDAFLIPGMIEPDSKAKRSQLSNEIAVTTQ